MEFEQQAEIKSISSFVPTTLLADTYYSGFNYAHDTYNALSAASDGNIYYVLSSESILIGGQMFVYNPRTDDIKFLGDLTEICGEKGRNAIPQGKSHVEFYEYQGKLYFSTHVGFYEILDGIERLPKHPKNGYLPYPGGHLLSYDLKTGQFEDLGMIPNGEGAVTMTMDRQRGQLYCISWPTGFFIHYNVHTKEIINVGPVSGKGEAGKPGFDYRVLCRSLLVDPSDGMVYMSTTEGEILQYNPMKCSLNPFGDLSLRMDYFGTYDYTRPGSMGYNWRKILWHAAGKVAYGVHGNSGYLFRFDPGNATIELVERLTSLPSRRCGMFDQFTYGYLGFQLGPDGQTLYYLTGGPIFENGKRLTGQQDILVGSKGQENVHLVTFNLETKKYIDHGPVFYKDGSRPSYVNTIAVGNDGTVYMLARMEHMGKTIHDLVRIPNPFEYSRRGLID